MHTCQQWIDCEDTVRHWLEATVMAVNAAQRTVRVHYHGYSNQWDEVSYCQHNYLTSASTTLQNCSASCSVLCCFRCALARDCCCQGYQPSIATCLYCCGCAARFINRCLLSCMSCIHTCFVFVQWISCESPRLAPFRTRTSAFGASLNPSLSPVPLHAAPSAPITGQDDLAAVLPQVPTTTAAAAA
jgi:hypothetical protein